MKWACDMSLDRINENEFIWQWRRNVQENRRYWNFHCKGWNLRRCKSVIRVTQIFTVWFFRLCREVEARLNVFLCVGLPYNKWRSFTFNPWPCRRVFGKFRFYVVYVKLKTRRCEDLSVKETVLTITLRMKLMLSYTVPFIKIWLVH